MAIDTVIKKKKTKGEQSMREQARGERRAFGIVLDKYSIRVV